MLNVQDIKSYIDPRSFLIGSGAVFLVYVLLFSYALFTGPSLLKNLESGLVKRSFIVENEGAKKAPLIAQAEQKEHKKDAHSAEHSPGKKKDAHKQQADHRDVPKKQIAADLIHGLYKKTKNGYLPIIRKRDGLTPFEGYRRSFVADPDKVQLALVFKDIGLSESVSMQAMEQLPKYVSMIVSPYARHIEKWQRASSAYGHELWLSVPAEDIHYPLSEPGPQGILSRANFEENRQRFLWALSRTHGYAGVAMHTDLAFASARNTIQGLAQSAFERGLGFLEMNSYGSNGLDRVAKEINAPYIANNLGGDVVFSEMIFALEQQAKDSGFVVAVLSPTLANVKAVARWSHYLDAKGIQLAPVSAAFTRHIRMTTGNADVGDDNVAVDSAQQKESH